MSNPKRTNLPEKNCVLTPPQRQAIIWQTEDESLSLSAISRRLNVHSNTVIGWQKKPHFKRELSKQRDRYMREVVPLIQMTCDEIIDNSLKQVKDLLDERNNPKDRLKAGDLAILIKIASDVRDTAVGEKPEEKKKEAALQVVDKLTAQELQVIAGRILSDRKPRTSVIRNPEPDTPGSYSVEGSVSEL